MPFMNSTSACDRGGSVPFVVGGNVLLGLPGAPGCTITGFAPSASCARTLEGKRPPGQKKPAEQKKTAEAIEAGSTPLCGANPLTDRSSRWRRKRRTFQFGASLNAFI